MINISKSNQGITPVWAFVVWRLVLVGLVFLAGAVIRPVARAGTAPYIVANNGSWSDQLVGAWSRWDGEWYLQIATHGYNAHDGTAAFFPLYPLLLKGLGWLLLGHYVLAGVLLSAGATAIVFILLYQLTSRDFDNRTATSSLLYLAVFPTVFFLAAIYTEALFLALILGAFLCVRHLQRWWLAGLLLGLATLCRSLGGLVVLPLIWEWWTQSRTQSPLNRKNMAKLLPLLLLPAFAGIGWLGFNWLVFDDPLTFLKAVNAPPWNRYSAWPWDTLITAFQTFGTPPPASAENYNLLNFIFLLVFLPLFGVAAWLTYRQKYPVSYLLYFGLALLLPLSAPVIGEPLTSFPRYVLVIFPAFQVLALTIRRIPILDMLYLLVGAVGLAFLCSRFVEWYWVA